MNPSSLAAWINPPPPGTEIEEYTDKTPDPKDPQQPKTKTVDDILSFVKSPEYSDPKWTASKRRRSRSKSHDRRRSRDRSKRDRKRHKRSRSRSRHHRHRNRSHSRSRRHKRHKRSSSSEARSSRSSSRGRNHRSHRSKYSRRSRSRRSRTYSPPKVDDTKVVDMEEEEEDEEAEPVKENAFKNDGSFLEMFKKLQEEQQQKAQEEASTSEVRNPLPCFGKRRGGRVLKTGMVQKTRSMQDSELDNPQDAWSVYMKEVKKYKEACCDDDSKTRPLVK